MYASSAPDIAVHPPTTNSTPTDTQPSGCETSAA